MPATADSVSSATVVASDPAGIISSTTADAAASTAVPLVPDGYGTIYYGMQYGTSDFLTDANVTLCKIVSDNTSAQGYDLVPLGILCNPLNSSNYVLNGDPVYMFEDVPYALPGTVYMIVAERNGTTWKEPVEASPDSGWDISFTSVYNPNDVVPGNVPIGNDTIYGWTKDIDGNDLAGATVTLMSQVRYESMPSLATYVSPNPAQSATGRFAGFYYFENVTPGWYTILVQKDSHKLYDTFNFLGNSADGLRKDEALPYTTSSVEREVDALPSMQNLADNGLYTGVVNNSTETGPWAASLNDSIREITPDGAGGLFAFGTDTVYRLDGNGNLLWNLTIPSQWCLSSLYWRDQGQSSGYSGIAEVKPEPIYAVSDGHLYLYLTPSAPYPDFGNNFESPWDAGLASTGWAIMAISPKGNVSWTKPLTTDQELIDSTLINATDDRVYVFHDYNETVMDASGKVLFVLPDVSDPASVDERGNLYVTQASPADPRTAVGGVAVIYPWEYDYWDAQDPMPDYRVPSSVVQAYDATGKLLWTQDIGEPVIRQYLAEDVRQQFGSLPLYQQGLLYVPVAYGVDALNTNGSQNWSVRLNVSCMLYEHMPIDPGNNVYLVDNEGGASQGDTWLYMVSDMGKTISAPRKYSEFYDANTQPAARDGIIYYVMIRNLDYDEPVENMPYAVVAAYDIRNDTILWAYQIAPGAEHETVIDANNSREITDFVDPYEYADILLGTNTSVIPSLGQANEVAFAGVYPAGDRIYVDFRAIKYEFPVKFGVSKVAYTSDIFTLYLNGTPAMRTDTGTLITAVAVDDNQVYYSTMGGIVIGSATATTAGIVAGIALLAALAIGTKMLLAGAVARARTRLNLNENRNLTMAYIREHPGSTLYEISRGLCMNLGTTRYHVLILGLNHKITTFIDGKFIRHFPNSHCYTREEQQLISLMRRGPTGDVIRALRSVPGLTSAEIARATGQNNSMISKVLKELCGKGVLDRVEADGSNSYQVSGSYAGLMAELAPKMKSDELLAGATSGAGEDGESARSP